MVPAGTRRGLGRTCPEEYVLAQFLFIVEYRNYLGNGQFVADAGVNAKQLSLLPPSRTWSHTRQTAEVPCEVALVGKTGGEGDF